MAYKNALIHSNIEQLLVILDPNCVKMHKKVLNKKLTNQQGNPTEKSS